MTRMTTDPVASQAAQQTLERMIQISQMRKALLAAHEAGEYEGEMDRLAEEVLYVLSVLPAPLASDHAHQLIKQLHKRKLHPSAFHTTWNVLKWLRRYEAKVASDYQASLRRV